MGLVGSFIEEVLEVYVPGSEPDQTAKKRRKYSPFIVLRGHEMLGESETVKLEFLLEDGDGNLAPFSSTLWVDKESLLPLRRVKRLKDDGPNEGDTEEYRIIRNRDVGEELFTIPQD